MVTKFGLAALLCLTLAGAGSPADGRALDARWQLNPAGQLELWFDPLHNGQPQYSEYYSVVLNDRAPKMCGDPDGTGRYTWFFTDALMIEVKPVRAQATPNYPIPQTQQELPR